MLDYKTWATSPTFACRHYICKVFSEKMEQAHKMHKGYMIITWKQHVSYKNLYHMYQ